MLKGIPENISPELLKVLSEMGHGDEIVIADGNFPSCSVGQIVINAHGNDSVNMLGSILKLFPLDQYDDNNFVLMQKCEGDDADTSVWNEFKEKLYEYSPNSKITFEERFDFYERAKKAYAVVSTSEKRQYANIILKKGCVL